MKVIDWDFRSDAALYASMQKDLDAEHNCKPTFVLITDYTEEDLRRSIQLCQKDTHVQQVAFSTYHDSITQICFTCQELRTSMKGTDIK